MNKKSTISKTNQEDFEKNDFTNDNSLYNEMADRISNYLDHIEENGEMVNKKAVNNVLNFSKSYRVLRSETLKHVELNLN